MDNKMTPNLFEIATSELSQDAFLCWLIQWADNSYADIDRQLNELASRFVATLLQELDYMQIDKVEAGRQRNSVDVWARINDTHFLIIENKTGTQEHSDQLNRYRKDAEKDPGLEGMTVSCAYFKMEEQSDLSGVYAANFHHVSRREMLDLLGAYDRTVPEHDKHDIVIDFYRHLQKVDAEYKSYKMQTLAQWSDRAWAGFFSELQKQFQQPHERPHEQQGFQWGYVPNPSGGFYGCWWRFGSSKIEGLNFQHYLQAERQKLVFKIAVGETEGRRVVRDRYREIVQQICLEQGLDVVCHGRLGTWMSVCRLTTDDYRVQTADDTLDFDMTVEHLRKATAVQDEIARQLREMS